MMSCKEYAAKRKEELKQYISEKSLHPCLVVIQVGDDPASNSYIRGKMRDCEEVGIECKVSNWEEGITTKTLKSIIDVFNRDNDVHGIIVQLPLPDHIDVKEIQSWISPAKDVDGFGYLSPFDPCTPAGVIGYLKAIDYEFESKDALVIGRSDIVGKPLARMLTDLDCTVTLAHSKSNGIKRLADYSDLIFTCIDRIEYYGKGFVRDTNADIIDIGLGRGSDGKLHGNLDAKTVEFMKDLYPERICISGTGGVGLLTRLALLENVVRACEMQTVPEFLNKKFNV